MRMNTGYHASSGRDLVGIFLVGILTVADVSRFIYSHVLLNKIFQHPSAYQTCIYINPHVAGEVVETQVMCLILQAMSACVTLY